MCESERQPADSHPDNRPGPVGGIEVGAEWFRHFYTSLLLGLIAIVVTAFLRPLPGITALDQSGDDLAQQVYAEGQPPPPAGVKLILLDLDFSRIPPGTSEVAHITNAIGRLVPLAPQAIMVDQVIRETVPDGIAKSFREAVLAAKPVRVVLVPTPLLVDEDGARETIPSGPINALRGASNVQFASPLLLPAPDGVIRSIPRSVCLDWQGEQSQPQETVPSFATSLSIEPPKGCDSGREAIGIIYSISLPGLKTSPALHRITEKDLDHPAQIASLVRGAIVMIGETGPAAWQDRHPTPIGMMPGVLIRANALLSPRRRTVPLDATGLDDGLLALAGSVIAGLFLAMGYRFRLWGMSIRGSSWGRFVRIAGALLVSTLLAAAASGAVLLLLSTVTLQVTEVADAFKLCMEVLTVALAATIFASYTIGIKSLCAWLKWPPVATCGLRLVCFAALACAFVVMVATLWVSVGALMLPLGLRVASLVPVFAAGLEVLVKAGRRVIGTLEIGVERAMRLAALPALVLLAFLSVSAQALDHPPPEQGDAAQTPATPQQPAFLPHRSLSAFLRLVLRTAPSPGATSGAGTRIRGTGATQALDWLPVLPPDQARLPVGATGLALAWTGGAGPYVVTLDGEASGDALGSFNTPGHLLWVPNFIMPNERVVLSVHDSGSSRLSARLVPAERAAPMAFPAAEASRHPTEAALTLFVNGGSEWRLEALRQVAVLAPTDRQAADALAGVRRAAEGRPPS